MQKGYMPNEEIGILKIESIRKEVNKTVIYELENGKNLRNREVKRGYLNRDELNVFMMLSSLSMLIAGERNLNLKKSPPIWDTWIEKGIMTPEQKKNLKTAHTFFNKFINDVFNNNLDITSKDKIIAQLTKFDFRLTDDYTIKKIYKLMESASKEFHLNQDEFFDLVEAKMEFSCKGCTKDRNTCETRILFESRFIPPVNEGSQCNCEYSY